METEQKNPPAAIPVERNILAACLRSKDALAKCVDSLSVEDFTVEPNKRIFDAMVNISGNSIDVDRVMVAQYLLANGTLQSIGGLSYLTELDDGMLSFNEGWIGILKEHTTLRKILVLGQDLTQRSSAGGEASITIVDSITDQVFQLSRRVDKSSPSSMAEFIDTFPGGLNELLQPHVKNQGLLFGFEQLDGMTDGLHNNELLAVSAAPGTGKTAWALQVAKNFTRRGDPVAIFSLEMGKQALFNRLCCSSAEVSVNRFRRGDLNQWERDAMLKAAGELYDLPLYIDETSALTVPKLAMRLERLASKYNIKLCIIDFLQMMESSSVSRNISDRMGEILYSLQRLRKDTGIPMLAMSQLRREPQQTRKAPTLADSFGTSAIEHTADMIAFLWREEISSPEKKEVRGLCDLMLRKNREGEVGTIKMRFIGWKQKFEEIPRQSV